VPLLIEPFVEYCRLRLAEDPHLWVSTLFDELAELGFTGSSPSLTAAIRVLGLRPHCEPCRSVKGRDVATIAHPAGEETQWDWIELPDPPAFWNAGKHAHLLVGALAHSSRWRGVLAPSEDFAHLVKALDAVVARLGGVSLRWRFDRMSTVCYPATGKLLPAFSAVAKHYGVAVDMCPARRGNRKGVVEKANHSAAQRWWRAPWAMTPRSRQRSRRWTGCAPSWMAASAGGTGWPPPPGSWPPPSRCARHPRRPSPLSYPSSAR
jgi:hypothetical protein